MKRVNAPKGARRYESRLRAEGAQRTRRAIVAAATDLFVERGYDATSLADIAAAAGVARPTVFAAFGSKPALLKQILDEALAGDDEPIPVAERPWFRPVWDAQTPDAVLAAYAKVVTLIGSRAAAMFEVVRRAGDPASDVRELWTTLLDNRRTGARMVVKTAAGRGRLRVDEKAAIDVLWVFNDPALYDALVTRCGWSERRFEQWIADQMRHALVP